MDGPVDEMTQVIRAAAPRPPVAPDRRTSRRQTRDADRALRLYTTMIIVGGVLVMLAVLAGAILAWLTVMH